MPVRPDGGMEAIVDQWVRFGRSAVLVEAKDFAERGFGILRRVEPLPFAVGEEQVSVGCERDAAAKWPLPSTYGMAWKSVSTFCSAGLSPSASVPRASTTPLPLSPASE